MCLLQCVLPESFLCSNFNGYPVQWQNSVRVSVDMTPRPLDKARVLFYVFQNRLHVKHIVIFYFYFHIDLRG